MVEGENFPHLNPDIDYTAGTYRLLLSLFDQSNFTLRGRTTLDIGGGQSDISAILRSRGTKAVVIDPAYAFPEELEQATDATLKRAGSLVAFEGIRARFRKDQAENPGYYLPAISTHLPFNENSIDLIYSEQTLCPVVSKDFETLEASFREIIRVLKPEGIAIIFPFDHYEQLARKQESEAQIQKNNLAKILERLDKIANVHYWVHEIPFLHTKSNNPLRTRKMLTIQKIAGTDQGKHL